MITEKEISVVSVSLCCLQIPGELETVDHRSGDTPIPETHWPPCFDRGHRRSKGVQRQALTVRQECGTIVPATLVEYIKEQEAPSRWPFPA